MKILFYKITDDPRKLIKTLGTVLHNLDCQLVDGTSIVSPSFLLTRNHTENFNDMNYCYIPDFKRYYFVNDWILENGNAARCTMHCDVLYTYRKEIQGISTLIERQENLYTPYIIDSIFPTLVSRSIERKIVGTLGTPTGANYALTVTGGE